ncbi:hypothetical protein B0T26DRAFT_697564, partial [Lasiosphaeria miniovina]
MRIIRTRPRNVCLTSDSSTSPLLLPAPVNIHIHLQRRRPSIGTPVLVGPKSVSKLPSAKLRTSRRKYKKITNSTHIDSIGNVKRPSSSSGGAAEPITRPKAEAKAKAAVRANHKVLLEGNYCRRVNQQFERLPGVLGNNPDDDSSNFLDQELAMAAVASLATEKAVSKIEMLDQARRRILAVEAD